MAVGEPDICFKENVFGTVNILTMSLNAIQTPSDDDLNNNNKSWLDNQIQQTPGARRYDCITNYIKFIRSAILW